MKQGKAQKIILIIIILLLILLAGIGYAYFATDIFRTPEQLFAKYLLNNVNQLTEFNFAPFDEVFKKMDEMPVEITSTQKSTDSYSEEETISTTKLRTDLPNRKESLNFELKVDDQQILNLDAAITNDIYGIRIKELHDKYLALENKDLKKIAETFELDQEIIDFIPNKIPESRVLSKEEKEKMESLLKKYGIRILEQLDDTAFAVEKNIDVNIDGENIKANKYSLTLSNKKILEIFNVIAKEILDDKEFLELCEIEDTKIIEELKNKNNELETKISEITEEVKITLAVYEKDKRTVKTEITQLDSNETSEFIIKDKNNLLFIVNIAKTDIQPISNQTKILITNTFEDNTGELSITKSEIFNQDDIKAASEKAKEKYSSAFSEDTDYYKKLYKDTTETVKLQSSKNGDNITTKYISDDEDDLNLQVNFKFDSNIKIDEITENNAIVVNNYTIEQFENLGKEILENALKSSVENPDSLIGSFFSMFNNSVQDDEIDFNVDFENPEYNPSIETNSDPEEYNRSIEDDRISVEEEITKAIDSCLENYHIEAESNPDTDPSNFLTVEAIKENCNSQIDIEFIDGTTLKCTLNDNEFITDISIDGNEWKLMEVKANINNESSFE